MNIGTGASPRACSKDANDAVRRGERNGPHHPSGTGIFSLLVCLCGVAVAFCGGFWDFPEPFEGLESDWINIIFFLTVFVGTLALLYWQFSVRVLFRPGSLLYLVSCGIVSFDSGLGLAFLGVISLEEKYRTGTAAFPISQHGFALWAISFAICLFVLAMDTRTASNRLHWTLGLDAVFFSMGLMAAADSLAAGASRDLRAVCSWIVLGVFYCSLVFLIISLPDTRLFAGLFDRLSLAEWKYWLSRNQYGDAREIDALDSLQRCETWSVEIRDALHDHVRRDSPLHQKTARSVFAVVGGVAATTLGYVLQLMSVRSSPGARPPSRWTAFWIFTIVVFAGAFVYSIRSYYWTKLEMTDRKVPSPCDPDHS